MRSSERALCRSQPQTNVLIDKAIVNCYAVGGLFFLFAPRQPLSPQGTRRKAAAAKGGRRRMKSTEDDEERRGRKTDKQGALADSKLYHNSYFVRR